MKHTIYFTFLFLLVTTVSAYEYTVLTSQEKDLTKVEYIYNNQLYDYWFDNYDNHCFFNNCTLNATNETVCEFQQLCDEQGYNDWIDTEMTVYIDDLQTSLLTDDFNENETIDANVSITGDLHINGTLYGASPLKIGTDIEMKGWSWEGFTKIRDIFDKIKEKILANKDRINTIEQETCQKDPTFSWC